MSLKVVVSGYGRMGHMVEKIVLEEGLEYAGWSEDIASFDKEVAKDCVCVDFTTPDAFRANYRAIAQNFKAAVVGTTGWYDIKEEVFACFRECGTPLIWASNFSVGVNVLHYVVAQTSRLLARSGGFQPYIIETHHIHKLDAPSGTAKTLAAEIEANMGEEPPISSVRVGEVPGIHRVGFESPVERITLEHEAFSREGLARGAVLAVHMTEGLEGVHEFKELFLGDF